MPINSEYLFIPLPLEIHDQYLVFDHPLHRGMITKCRACCNGVLIAYKKLHMIKSVYWAFVNTV